MLPEAPPRGNAIPVAQSKVRYSLSPWEKPGAVYESVGDLVWDFGLLCNDRKAFNKIQEFEAFTDVYFDESIITAICEHQLSLPLKEFMTTGFVGHVV